MKAEPKTPARKGAGRNCLYGSEPLKPKTFRATKAQREKVDRLGGDPWLRDQIDKAEEPGPF